MTIGKKIEVEPVTLATMATATGNRKLVFSGCGEYLVIDRVADKVIGIQIFQEKEFTKAATAFGRTI